jgi:hypothetical protein
VLRVEVAELKSRSAFLGACTSCPVLHAKIDEMHAYSVSLEAKLKEPIVTSCSTHEMHAFEGPIRRTREGGSEWEPIKILLEGDGNSNKMNTASNTRLRLTTKVGQAHVATGPRSQHTTFRPEKRSGKTKPRAYRTTPVRR